MPFSQRGELGIQLLNNAFNGNCRRREATSNLAGLLGTVAVAKDPGNLPGSLSKPPEVDELALLCLRVRVEAVNTPSTAAVAFHAKQLESSRYEFAGYLAADVLFVSAIALCVGPDLFHSGLDGTSIAEVVS